MSRRWKISAIALLVLGSLLIGGSTYRSVHPGKGRGATTGIASFYGAKHHGRKTASSEKFDMNKMTAAHKTLPFGQIVRVTNLENGRSVDVIINDRGPFVRNRIIDLSYAAAGKLGMVRSGTARIRVETLKL